MIFKETETLLQSTRSKAVFLRWSEIFIFKRKNNNIKLLIVFKVFDKKVLCLIYFKSKISRASFVWMIDHNKPPMSFRYDFLSNTSRQIEYVHCCVMSHCFWKASRIFKLRIKGLRKHFSNDFISGLKSLEQTEPKFHFIKNVY